MYTRTLELPSRTFFLFGPRATGKSTWLRERLREAAWFDLLRTSTLLELGRNPDLFRARVEALPARSWIVVDEVQRMPVLLDEVHALIAEHGNRYRFALTGSSARKLRRNDVNLLAGRAITRHFFPLTGQELGFDFDINNLLAYGSLPSVRSEPDDAVDLLEAYVGTYLREEIMQEALTRDVTSFSRFLEVAALMNGQVINTAGIARDSGVARPTVARYFDVLVDTLVGCRLQAWRPRVRVRETQHPKFYLFDTGVVRAILGRLRGPLEREERGPLLETLILNELLAAMNVSNTGGELSYWRTPSGVEVDFIWERGRSRVGIEVKASRNWRREYTAPLATLLDDGTLKSAWGVYTGTDSLSDRGVKVLPVVEFMRRLAAGAVLR